MAEKKKQQETTKLNINTNNHHEETITGPSISELNENLEYEDEDLMKEFKEISTAEYMTKISDDDTTSLNLKNICLNGHTFLWDLLVSHSSLNEDQLRACSNVKNNEDEGQIDQFEVSKSSQQTRPVQNYQEKILKEAEKQLQTLLCLPSTDKRIRVKFIESCLGNLRQNKACVFSLRLLIKLFSSFQQYSTNNSSNITSPEGKFIFD